MNRSAPESPVHLMLRMRFVLGWAAPIVLLSVSVFAAGQALAVPMRVTQEYNIGGTPNFREDLTNTLITATFFFDSSGLTNSGQELISLDAANLAFSNRGLPGLVAGLTFDSVVNPAQVGQFFAYYTNGVFRAISWQDNGGALFRASFFPNSPGINTIAFTLGNFGQGQLSMLSGFTVPRYNIAAPTPALVEVIPEPSTALLMGLGLLGMSVVRRRDSHG